MKLKCLTDQVPAQLWVACLFAAYYILGKLGLLLAVPPGYATAIWAPSGIALAGLLLGGYRLWPGVFLGSVAVNLTTSFDPSGGWATTRSLIVVLGVGAGAAMQAVLGAFLVQRYIAKPFELIRVQEVARFFLLGGPLACLSSASIGVGTLLLAGSIRPDQVSYSWWTWWVGDSIGVCVITPLLLVWLSEPRAVWRRRRHSVALPLVCVLLLTVSLFIWISRIDEARIRLEFDEYAAEITNQVTSNFESAIRVVRSLADLHVATPEAERAATFSTFARRTLAANPGIQALSWNPRVAKDERRWFELSARKEGQREFDILERNPDGSMVPAASRDEHVVVLHIEPAEANATVRGFDVASDPLRRKALLRACVTGQPAATEPIRLIQGIQYGILVFSPVYPDRPPLAPSGERCRAIRGFATGVLRIHDLMASALRAHVDPNIRVVLLNDDGTDREHPIWSNGSPADQGPEPPAAAAEELSHVAHISVGGQRLSILFTATPSYRIAAGTWRPWIALAGGMLFAGLLTAFLLVVTGNVVTIERLGWERAAELSKANDDLQREIADRKQVERALKQNEDRLRQAQKMEAVGQLAGGVAHDFNNLLTVIVGYSELLAERIASDHEATSDLTEIRRASGTAASLTRQLLAFSRKQILAPQILDLNDVVLGTRKMLARLLEENITIQFRAQPSPAKVHADPGQLEQVVLNLAINARDAMPRGGTLTIETATVVLDQNYADCHAGVTPGPYVALSLSDTGTGMTPEVKSRVFEPFFTTKPRGQGTGLGLATVYGIVKQSGGEIDVYSEPGLGTTFKIYLPAVSQSDVVAAADSHLPDLLTGSDTVLVVEDERSLRAIAEKILRQYGYTVLSASSVPEGLQVSAEHPGSIHLLLTDVVMPGGSGRDLAEKVMASRPDVKVIYMSGYTDDAIVQHGVLVPGTVFLQKPFTPQALGRKLREVLDE
jgi:signal transduction histidine kinase/integral membrane sensor domain MASE1